MTQRQRAPIFVVGYQHSGTTVLQYVLARHSAINTSYYESTIFEHKYMIEQRFPNLRRKDEFEAYVHFLVNTYYNGFNLEGGHTLAGNTADGERDIPDATINDFIESYEGPRSHGALFAAVNTLIAIHYSCPRWLEKTPTHIYYVQDILDEIPDALFVEIVRDPRDIVASKKTRLAKALDDRRYDREQRRIRHLTMAFDPVLDSLSWRATVAVGATAAAEHPNRWYRLRYEDFTREPTHEIQELCDHLALEFEPSMLNVSGQGGAEWEDHMGTRGIRQDSVGRWKTVLSPVELAATQWVASREMSKLGYSLAQVEFATRMRIPFALLGSAVDIVQRLIKKWKLGGWEYLSNVLRNWRDRLLRFLFGSSI